MRRVKVIDSWALTIYKCNFYLEYLESFLQQDIKIIDIKQLGEIVPRFTTIVYECDDNFIDATGGSAVKLTIKKNTLIVKEIK